MPPLSAKGMGPYEKVPLCGMTRSEPKWGSREGGQGNKVAMRAALKEKCRLRLPYYRAGEGAQTYNWSCLHGDRRRLARLHPAKC